MRSTTMASISARSPTADKRTNLLSWALTVSWYRVRTGLGIDKKNFRGRFLCRALAVAPPEACRLCPEGRAGASGVEMPEGRNRSSEGSRPQSSAPRRTMCLLAPARSERRSRATSRLHMNCSRCGVGSWGLTCEYTDQCMRIFYTAHDVRLVQGFRVPVNVLKCKLLSHTLVSV